MHFELPLDRTIRSIRPTPQNCFKRCVIEKGFLIPTEYIFDPAQIQFTVACISLLNYPSGGINIFLHGENVRVFFI